MKWILILTIASATLFSGCKSCKERKKQHDINEEVPAVTLGATTGTISHNEKEGGCTTITVIQGEEEIVLIPVKGLPAELDKDGNTILFDYNTLKMPQPEGCNVGIPAEIRNASLKK
ncbi:MAG: hypothetical protein CVU11_13030 [Bacteroidetes bacterium HGW-Bacteroidetes-6]|jgi:hypothetical protein|nr:MAG: hypothetical protein CVU11_13030 [Bacteroidetes bacterium HGW-Bacteroidetes-6]